MRTHWVNRTRGGGQCGGSRVRVPLPAARSRPRGGGAEPPVLRLQSGARSPRSPHPSFPARGGQHGAGRLGAAPGGGSTAMSRLSPRRAPSSRTPQKPRGGGAQRQGTAAWQHHGAWLGSGTMEQGWGRPPVMAESSPPMSHHVPSCPTMYHQALNPPALHGVPRGAPRGSQGAFPSPGPVPSV